MPKLSSEIVGEIAELLNPVAMSELERQALLVEAFGAGHPLTVAVTYGASPQTFSTNLITRLNTYGEVEPGKPALIALLEKLKLRVGYDVQQRIDGVIASLVNLTTSASGTSPESQQQEQKTVFISYRRKPARYIARAIFQSLRDHGYDVFMDVEGIDAGEFRKIIRSQIEARTHFLVILTSGTVGDFDKPDDWLRFEIEYAMQHKRNIVPLLIDKFSFNKQTNKSLTGKLADLSNYQALTIHHDLFEASMDKLRTRFLQVSVPVVITETPPEQQAEVERRIDDAAAQPQPTPAELSAEDYFNMAIALGDNSAQVIAYYNEAIRINPQYAAAYINRGNVRQDNDDFSGAIADFTRSIELKYPKLHLPYYNRGNARKASSDLSGALTDYDEAIRINPQYADAYNNRGATRKDNGDITGAIADYEEALRFNPQYAPAYCNRGIAREASGDLSGALEDYQKYLDLGGGEKVNNRERVEHTILNLQRKLNAKS
jgi:tetratricopeptide (TPR) repeat protein